MATLWLNVRTVTIRSPAITCGDRPRHRLNRKHGPPRVYARRTNPGRIKIAELHADDVRDLESSESRNDLVDRRRRRASMFLAIRTATLNIFVFASIAALGIIFPTSPADEPAPDHILREQGLVRSGVAYVFKEEVDLRDRIAEIGRQLATWKEEQAGLDERLETLSRLRLQHEEVLKKLRLLARGRRPDAKEYRRPPFPGEGPPGRGPTPPPPDSGPFQAGAGPPPPPPDGMNDFGPGPREDFVLQLQIGEAGRQYTVLNAERAALAADITYKQVFTDDLAKRLERQLEDIERRRLEAVTLNEQIRSRYDKLAIDARVKEAVVALNNSSNPTISLGPLKDYSKDLSEPAGAIAAAKEGLLKRMAQVELKGISRLTGLVGVAEMLLQEMGYSTGRMQTLEREAASRRHLLAEQAKQRSSLDEKLIHAADTSERKPVTNQLHANEARADTLRTEGIQLRESVAEVIQLLAAEREDFLRIVTALKDAIDEADTERRTRTNNAQIQKSSGRRSGDEPGSDRVASTEPFKSRLRELEKTIHSEEIPIDADKTLHWIDATLNGKSRKPMLVDLGINEIRLSARLATEIGARLEADQVVEIAMIDGRIVRARTARLETVQVGPFTHRDVDCVVLPESAGEFPSVLGSSFFDRFSTRMDADRGAIVLTQVQVKPILHSNKASSFRSAVSSKSRKTAPAAGAGRSSTN
jgi:predicted aspartyl protease